MGNQNTKEEEKVLSIKEKVLSTTEKVLSTKEKVLSTEQKVLSTEQKVLSTEQKVLPVLPDVQVLQVLQDVPILPKVPSPLLDKARREINMVFDSWSKYERKQLGEMGKKTSQIRKFIIYIDGSASTANIDSDERSDDLDDESSCGSAIIIQAQLKKVATTLAEFHRNYDLTFVQFEFYAFSSNVVPSPLGNYLFTTTEKFQKEVLDVLPKLIPYEMSSTNLLSVFKNLFKSADNDVPTLVILATDGMPDGDPENVLKLVEENVSNFPRIVGLVTIGAGSIGMMTSAKSVEPYTTFKKVGHRGEFYRLSERLLKFSKECDDEFLRALASIFGGVYVGAFGDYTELRKGIEEYIGELEKELPQPFYLRSYSSTQYVHP